MNVKEQGDQVVFTMAKDDARVLNSISTEFKGPPGRRAETLSALAAACSTAGIGFAYGRKVVIGVIGAEAEVMETQPMRPTATPEQVARLRRDIDAVNEMALELKKQAATLNN